MAGTSLLASIGKDIKGVFSWLGSAKGQSVIAAGEGVAETIAPQITGIVNLANQGLAEILKMEALAVAAGEQSGSGASKSAAVVSSLTPQILEYAQQNGLPTPTATKIQAASDALVAFMNALDGKS
jgi:hypothetical protein